ncbi:general transcription factor IIH subunit 2-like [Gigantopelta aegis]|uniref:general transcription factor IIH subunit 2-like n=1 Tax=Gigantopelta aegis TaxID=1735272 RepID=UPI001B88A835|nr:general transcription factor IIH subunit 2-like [Gigantopelta aegis]
MAEEDEKGYRWETEYEKTWEALTEDASGSLQASIDEIVQKGKKRRLLEKIGNIRLGMMRHLFLVLDMSSSMGDQDLKPTRLLTTLKLLEYFVEEYFDQNPISQLGIIATRNKRAEKLTELGGNPRRHIVTLQSQSTKTCEGEPSLQNSLELAIQTLKHVPSHASREVLVIFGGLTTCDPGDIHDTMKTLHENNIRCSVIGLAAEVRVCKKLCQVTHGKYNVILDESHFKDLLIQHVSPPPATADTESSLIRMGFPHHTLSTEREKEEKPSMCMCHLDKTGSQGFSTSGYFCPQCKSKYCELPVECRACGLTLVSAPHLARSYHHLFPLNSFIEVPVSKLGSQKPGCYACQVVIKESNVYRCEKCSQIYCLDCDLFVHETLHSCPGCASFRRTQLQTLLPVL